MGRKSDLMNGDAPARVSKSAALRGGSGDKGHWYIYCAAVVSFVFCLATWGFLTWLLWSYVPVQAASAAVAGAMLPLTTRVTIAASNLYVRLTPSLVVLVPVVGVVVVVSLIVVARRMARPTPEAFALLCAVVLVVLALVAVAASGVVVVCMHLPIAELAEGYRQGS